jgi:hypothetical protein
VVGDILTLDHGSIACVDHQWPATYDRSGPTLAVRSGVGERPESAHLRHSRTHEQMAQNVP